MDVGASPSKSSTWWRINSIDRRDRKVTVRRAVVVAPHQARPPPEAIIKSRRQVFKSGPVPSVWGRAVNLVTQNYFAPTNRSL
jgi:hypothetical protein